MEPKKNILRTLLLIAIITASLLPKSAFGTDILKIGGAGSALGSMRLLADSFEKSHPGVKVQVLPSVGSPGGIKAVLDGVIGIGISGRPLAEEERKRGESK